MRLTRTADVERLLVSQLRGVKGIENALPDEVLSHAGLMRAVRNYGVHQGGTDDPALDVLFDQTSCGLLLLMTRHHLSRLGAAVDLAVSPPASP